MEKLLPIRFGFYEICPRGGQHLVVVALYGLNLEKMDIERIRHPEFSAFGDHIQCDKALTLTRYKQALDYVLHHKPLEHRRIAAAFSTPYVDPNTERISKSIMNYSSYTNIFETIDYLLQNDQSVHLKDGLYHPSKSPNTHHSKPIEEMLKTRLSYLVAHVLDDPSKEEHLMQLIPYLFAYNPSMASQWLREYIEQTNEKLQSILRSTVRVANTIYKMELDHQILVDAGVCKTPLLYVHSEDLPR